MRVLWSDRALDRVAEVAAYIAQDSEPAAVRWVEDLFDAVERLTGFPELGKLAAQSRSYRMRLR